MNTKKLSRLLSVVSVVACFTSLGTAYSQVAPAAHQGELPFTIGAGASNLDVDWGHNRMYGYTIWGQWRPRPSGVLAGLGLDAEIRNVDYGRSSTLPSNFKQVTGSGGPMFTVRALRSVQPYGKFLIGLGSIDFHVPGYPYYTHDTRTIYAPGGGIQLRVHHHLWVRADYEYQFWPGLFGVNKTLDPQGFTLGFNYDFRPTWR